MFIVKVPGINGLGKTKGCERAGNAILDSLKEIYSNEQGIPVDVNLLDLEEIHVNNSDLELANDLIYKNSFKIKPASDLLSCSNVPRSLSKRYLQNSVIK